MTTVHQDEKEISEKIKLYIGFTFGGGAKMTMDPKELEKKIDNKRYFKFSGKKIFVHPLLGTSEVMSFCGRSQRV